MSPALIASKALSMFLLFPGNLLLVLAVAWLLLRGRHRRWGLALLMVSVVATYILSMPAVSYRLAHSVDYFPALTPQAVEQGATKNAQAIVVLSGGFLYHQPEFGGANVSVDSSLERIRYGAYLHKMTQLPILVSGGVPVDGETAGQTMARDLVQSFGVPVQWVEGRSENTAQNARFSWEILQAEGITHIVLVTTASHMRRALESFEKAGFTVVPAATSYVSPPLDNVLQYLPKLDALGQSNTALHEWLGRLWYEFRGK